jgi:hypothetical protein
VAVADEAVQEGFGDDGVGRDLAAVQAGTVTAVAADELEHAGIAAVRMSVHPHGPGAGGELPSSRVWADHEFSCQPLIERFAANLPRCAATRNGR